MKKVHNIGFMKLVSVLTVSIVVFSALNTGVLAVNNVDSTEMTKNSSNRQNVLIIDWNDAYEVMIGCEPIVKGDDVLVPMNEFMTMTDYTVLSENGESDVTISNGNRKITITANSKNAVVDGKEITLDKAICSENNLLYISVEDLEKLFSYKVSYDSKNNNIILTVTDNTPKPIKTIIPSEKPQDSEIPRTVNVIVSGAELQIEVDNKPVIFGDMKPFIDEKNRTQVPIRALAEMLNCNEIVWNQQTQVITIIDADGKVLTIQVGDNKISVDGKIIEMDTVTKIINNRAYLPLRFVAEALGLNVSWK